MEKTNPIDQIIKTNCFDGMKCLKNKSLTRFAENVTAENNKEEILDKVLAKRNILPELDTDAIIIDNLVELNRKNLLEDKRRQRLRETNHDLMMLEKKLNAAYVNKAVMAQKAEKELQKSREKAFRAQEDEIIEKARVTFVEHERYLEELREKNKRELRKELQNQMELHKMEQARKYEDFLEEKKTVEQIVKRVYNEQLDDMRRRCEFKAQSKLDFRRVIKEKEEAQKIEIAHDKEVDKAIVEVVKQHDATKLANEQIKRDKIARRDSVAAILGQKINTIATEKRKRMSLLEDLLIEEKNARNDEKFKEKLGKEYQSTMEFRQQLGMMKDFKDNRLLHEIETERQYQEQLDEELAEQDRLHALECERKRQQNLEHKRAFMDTLDYRKRLHAEELAKVLVERKKDIKEEKLRQELVEEERMKMLKQHAPALLGYFPPGVFRPGDELHLPLPPKAKE